MTEKEMDFSKMKVGMKTLDDAVVNLGVYKKINSNFGDKDFILKAINRRDYKTLKEISNYYYDSSGIYQRLCKYMAYLYRYDWYVTPFSIERITPQSESKLLKDFSAVLNYLDNSDIRRVLGNVALEVMKSGVYYGIILDQGDRFTIQQLPSEYCRCRYFKGSDPVVELNMQFFDSYFTNIQHRMRILQIFPKEVQKAYVAYKEGKLSGGSTEDGRNWFMLDPATSVRFNLGGSDLPPLVGSIPSLIDLDLAQDLDRKKTMQQLLKVIIQKLPIDKDGELVFDIDEARDLHNNAVAMLRRAVGVDVLTTFADIDVVDMQDKNSTTTSDDLQKAERTVYNNLGVSQNLFNTEGNIALEKSILNDEAAMRDLLLQFNSLLNRVVKKFNRPRHYNFQANILETTVYNYKDISKMYKEQTQIGYSRMLPQIALGHSQSSIIAAAHFENEVLHLDDIMIPPVMSSTMSGKNVGKNAEGATSNSQVETKADGRPEKETDQKSDKTLANIEAQ